MTNRIRLLFIGVLPLLTFITGVLLLRADTTVRCTNNGANQTVCRIDEPNVRQQSTDYQQVAFRGGDTVTMTAGGCVQTGGSGRTWKRYVNPSGPNSNRLYWGTISIPGATQGLVRISSVMGRSLTIPANATPSYLRLGYVDDGYGDNSYSDHDDGTEDQCKDVGNAFVSLTINHAPGVTSGCGGTTGNSPLDLVWTDCDPNGFPKNPRWRYQVDHNGMVPPAAPTVCKSGYGPSCSSWPLTNDSGFWCGPHRNWFAVTYEGVVDWEDKSDAGSDDDYNYRVFTPHDEGVLAHLDSTINGFETEFDSDETIDHFSSPVWTQFHMLVDSSNSAAQAAVKSKAVVLTGLLGLDCGHEDCSPELHPAYALGVNMDNSNLSNDTWAVFARNWGDEGFCSSNQHNLPVNSLKIQIPWLPGATAVTIGPDTQFYVFANSGSNASVGSPSITYAVGQGILMDFSMADPSAQLGVEGELHLQWTVPPGGRNLAIVSRAAALRTVTRRGAGKEEVDKPEAKTSALVSKLSTVQRQTFMTRNRAMIAARTVPAARRLQLRPAALVAALPQPPRRATPPAVIQTADPRRAQKSEALRVSLCEAYRNSVPGFPPLCLANPRVR